MNFCSTKSFKNYIIIFLLIILFKEKMAHYSCIKDAYKVSYDLVNKGKEVRKEKFLLNKYYSMSFPHFVLNFLFYLQLRN